MRVNELLKKISGQGEHTNIIINIKDETFGKTIELNDFQSTNYFLNNESIIEYVDMKRLILNTFSILDHKIVIYASYAD